MYRRLISICLILVLLVDWAGYYPVFKYQQWEIQKSVKQMIKESVPLSQLHVFSVNKGFLSSLKWEREGKEFCLNGHMYDVVYKSEKAQKLFFYCINDTQESILFAKLKDHVNRYLKNQLAKGKNSLTRFLKTFITLLYLPTDLSVLTCYQTNQKQFVWYNDFYSQIVIENTSPPPQYSFLIV